MKLLELEIFNVRGIPYLHLEPGDKNMVIWGPNGSGKSSVVDAIDFLLTGHISRLAGKGTGNIKLMDHGPHIDHKPDEAEVRAKVMLPGIAKPVEIKRRMDNPGTLQCDPAAASRLKQVETLASRGQYILTRREILKFITSDGNTRARQIQELLNITEVEKTRQTLGTTLNKLTNAYKTTKHTRDTTRSHINANTEIKTYSDVVVLDIVNKNRAILKGQPITALKSSIIRKGLNSPGVSLVRLPVNSHFLNEAIQNLRQQTSAENLTQLTLVDQELRNAVSIVKANPYLLRSLSQLKLLELGATLIDKTGYCPLCDTPWPSGALQLHLEQKLSRAQSANKLDQQISASSIILSEAVNQTIVNLQQILDTTRHVNVQLDLSALQTWLNNLRMLSKALNEPVDKYLNAPFTPEQVQRLLAPSMYLESLFSVIQSKVEEIVPKSSPEQIAWERLIRLEENVKNLEDAEQEFQSAQLAYQKAEILSSSFVKARDKVLCDIYDTIRDRFVELYRKLHGADEGTFTAKLEPVDASLNLEVDFYSRGTHPPHALHSEGHQDSMGLCLYLALAEQLNQQLVNLIILDDVVMSIDAGHRRKICTILTEVFSDRQFLIATHDKTWATQLRSEGVVNSRGTVEFYRWNVQTGPNVSQEVDLWHKITQDLENNDVSAAAARLRRGSEHFFEMICDSLQARVKYKSSGRWELGDFLPAAMGQYKEILKQAKKSANSWGDANGVAQFTELESVTGAIFQRTQTEQWGVNASVHYNNWADLQPEDFQPIIDAFQDLYGLYICSQCGGLLYVISKGMQPAGARCNCGKINWNLITKGT